jgi:carboxylate-amine ligase
MIPLVSSPGTSFSEYLEVAGSVHPAYRAMMDILDGLGTAALQERWKQAKREVKPDGFSFLLGPKNFRPVPTNWIPRVIRKDEWDLIGRGVEQRLRAINRFLVELYDGAQTIVPGSADRQQVRRGFLRAPLFGRESLAEEEVYHRFVQ